MTQQAIEQMLTTLLEQHQHLISENKDIKAIKYAQRKINHLLYHYKIQGVQYVQ